VARPSWFQGFDGARRELKTALSPRDWANGILEDEPANGRTEVARLTRERFREGVRELLTNAHGVAFSGALVLGSSAAALRESRFKASEELQELGPGASRFSAAPIPHAVGLQSASRTTEQGPRFAVSVVFASGHCSLGVGLIVSPANQPRTRQQVISTATRVGRAVRHLC
jgi:hypothetical protein